MKIWIERSKINGMAAALNTLDLEIGRLQTMLRELQLQSDPKAKATMTLPETKPADVELRPTFECSVCGRTYMRHELSNAFSVPKANLPEGIQDFSTNPNGQALVRTCSLGCTEKFSLKLSMKNAGIMEPYQKGIITH